ncbi:hypothetical protein [Acidovorax cavernicola]|nr:hypothetical protein [Acidovorax cavernicola]
MASVTTDFVDSKHNWAKLTLDETQFHDNATTSVIQAPVFAEE